jgi:type IV pilus assembly protein PilW
MSSRALRTTKRVSQRGLSIIELMVGVVIALLVGLAATQSAITFTATQRQGVGAGGLAVNASTVMSAIKDDLAAAGLGFFGSSAYLCDRLNLSVNGAIISDGALFSPLSVTRAAAGDQIDVIYGNQVESGANVLLRAASNGNTAALMSYLPVTPGQAVLIAPAEPGPIAPPCLVRTVSVNTPAIDDAAQQLAFAAAGANIRHNTGIFTNNPGFVEGDRIAQLGALRWTRYRIDGTGSLVVERPLDNTSAVLARNVTSFRIQYGVSDITPAGTPLNTTVTAWVDPTGVFGNITSANLQRVRAIRIGMIVRSPQIQKADADGVCRATADKPALFGMAPENLDNADWNCWRYRTTTVVVPLRNIVMGLR